MKRRLCYLLLVFALVISCLGCGKNDSQKDETESEMISTETEFDSEIDVIVGNTEIRDNFEKESTADVPAQNPITNKNESEHKHSYSVTNTVNATCTSNGSKTYTCSSCSHSYTETISATGHSWNSATCTTAKTCSVCNMTEGSALGHSENANGNCERCGVALIVISDAEREKYMAAACAMNWFFETSKFPRTVCFTNVYYTTDNGSGNKMWLVEGYGENNFGGNSYAYIQTMLYSEPKNKNVLGLPFCNYKLNDTLYAHTVAYDENPYSNNMWIFTEKLDEKKLKYMYYQLFDEYEVQFD